MRISDPALAVQMPSQLLWSQLSGYSMGVFKQPWGALIGTSQTDPDDSFGSAKFSQPIAEFEFRADGCCGYAYSPLYENKVML